MISSPFCNLRVEAQTQQTLTNIGSVLHAAGVDFKDIVKTTVYLSDMKNYGEMNKVYFRFFDKV